MEKAEKYKYLKTQPAARLFSVLEPTQAFPERVSGFKSVKYECCGETTSENMIRLQEGQKVGLNCFVPYSRFI